MGFADMQLPVCSQRRRFAVVYISKFKSTLPSLGASEVNLTLQVSHFLITVSAQKKHSLILVTVPFM